MLKKLISSFTFLLLTCAANAGVIEFVIGVGSMPTNFEVNVEAPQFDDMGGTRLLNSVTLTIDGEVSGSGRAESLAATPQTIELTLAAELTLSDTSNSALIVVTPSVTNTFHASAYDGITDFGGTSGITYSDLFSNKLMSQTFSNVGLLAYFSGTDFASLILSASATSFASGPSGFPTSFDTNAAAQITIEYRYTSLLHTPTPSNLALLSLGLLGFCAYRKLMTRTT